MVLRHHIVAFWVLALAFVVSAVYQLYRSAFMEIPRYDAFTPRPRASPTPALSACPLWY
jgi:hypothetical protein